MQATNHQAVWPKNKYDTIRYQSPPLRPKLEEEVTGDVSLQSAEPTNTAEMAVTLSD